MTREESRLTARAGDHQVGKSRKISGNLGESRGISGSCSTIRSEILGESRGISGNLRLLLDDQVERAVEVALRPLLLPLSHVLGAGGEEAEAGAPC